MSGSDLHGEKSYGLPGGSVEAAVFLAVALAISLQYAFSTGYPLFWDEYYHLLAARSWAESGALTIGDGLYTRSAWFSVLVGRAFRTFGESVAVARLPGAIALSLWCLAVFLWVRSHSGRAAAWMAATALCLGPVVLVNSVMVRFYGVSGLLFWLGCIAALAATSPGSPPLRRGLMGLAAAALLYLCYLTTPLARLWLGCFGVWLGCYAAVAAARSRYRLVLLGGAALAGAIAAVWAVQSGWLINTWTFYQEVPAWGVERAGDVRWYARLIKQDYPTLWTLLPVATIVTLRRQPRAGTMVATVLAAGLVFLSLGGSKAERYILPLLPFFFVLWGMALAELLPALRDLVGSAVTDLLPASMPPAAARPAGWGALAAVVAFALVTNAGFIRARNSQDRLPQGLGASPSAWQEAAETLLPLYDQVDVVITSNSIQALYHLGDYDYAMRTTVVGEFPPREEFGVDPRTGRPAISTLESLTRVVSENAHGLIFGERWRWGHPAEGFTEAVADHIRATMENVPLPERLGVIAYRW